MDDAIAGHGPHDAVLTGPQVRAGGGSGSNHNNTTSLPSSSSSPAGESASPSRPVLVSDVADVDLELLQGYYVPETCDFPDTPQRNTSPDPQVCFRLLPFSHFSRDSHELLLLLIHAIRVLPACFAPCSCDQHDCTVTSERENVTHRKYVCVKACVCTCV